VPRLNCPRSIDLITRRGRRFGQNPSRRLSGGRPRGGATLEWSHEIPEPIRPPGTIVPLARRERPRSPAAPAVEARPAPLPHDALAPEPLHELSTLQRYLERGGLGTNLIDLVWVRTSILNGDPSRLEVHFSEAVAHGERPDRLLQLREWEASTAFTERERCALAWTDALSQLSRSRVTEEMYHRVRQQFTDREVADLSWAVVAMNAWNRLAIAFRISPRPAGTGVPGSI
jgi:alkylhydroperoxidase family enzyme